MEDQDFLAPDELLVKYLGNEASTQEREEVERWLAQDLQNKRYFDELSLIWGKSTEVDQGDLESLDRAWGNFKEKVASPKVLPLQRNYWLMAAAFALLALSIGAILFFNRQTQEAIPAFTLYESTDSDRTVILADSSQVYLKQTSKLQVASNYGQGSRKMILEGKAVFDVEPDPEVPFVVIANDVEVKVLGTVFEVDMRKNGVAVAVQRGKVQVSASEEKKVILEKGEKIDPVSASNWNPEVLAIESNRFSWQNKSFLFENTYMRDVLADLMATYQVDISINNSALNNCIVTTRFEGESLPYILDVLGVMLEFEWEQKGDAYVLMGGGCK
ncbi:MAG: FecR domain-containing protein [Bacteroidia bacterium]|nr:FecR domain-containing protein [Bacteroidia bacterium]